MRWFCEEYRVCDVCTYWGVEVHLQEVMIGGQWKGKGIIVLVMVARLLFGIVVILAGSRITSFVVRVIVLECLIVQAVSD